MLVSVEIAPYMYSDTKLPSLPAFLSTTSASTSAAIMHYYHIFRPHTYVCMYVCRYAHKSKKKKTPKSLHPLWGIYSVCMYVWFKKIYYIDGVLRSSYSVLRILRISLFIHSIVSYYAIWRSSELTTYLRSVSLGSFSPIHIPTRIFLFFSGAGGNGEKKQKKRKARRSMKHATCVGVWSCNILRLKEKEKKGVKGSMSLVMNKCVMSLWNWGIKKEAGYEICRSVSACVASGSMYISII